MYADTNAYVPISEHVLPCLVVRHDSMHDDAELISYVGTAAT